MIDSAQTCGGHTFSGQSVQLAHQKKTLDKLLLDLSRCFALSALVALAPIRRGVKVMIEGDWFVIIL